MIWFRKFIIIIQFTLFTILCVKVYQEKEIEQSSSQINLQSLLKCPLEFYKTSYDVYLLLLASACDAMFLFSININLVYLSVNL